MLTGSDLALTGGLASALAAIAWIDLRTLRIPDVLSLPLIAAGLMLALFRETSPGFVAAAVGAAAGFALFAAIGEIWFRRTGTEALGLGDAKLFAAAGAWLGWAALPYVLLVAALSGIALALASGRHGPLPFGPPLAIGILGGWIWRLAGG